MINFPEIRFFHRFLNNFGNYKLRAHFQRGYWPQGLKFLPCPFEFKRPQLLVSLFQNSKKRQNRLTLIGTICGNLNDSILVCNNLMALFPQWKGRNIFMSSVDYFINITMEILIKWKTKKKIYIFCILTFCTRKYYFSKTFVRVSRTG